MSTDQFRNDNADAARHAIDARLQPLPFPLALSVSTLILPALSAASTGGPLRDSVLPVPLTVTPPSLRPGLFLRVLTTQGKEISMTHLNTAATTLPNQHRISTARFALDSASWARGDNPAICDEAVIDLLADLRHFCIARHIDFNDCNRIAESHFEAEITGSQS